MTEQERHVEQLARQAFVRDVWQTPDEIARRAIRLAQAAQHEEDTRRIHTILDELHRQHEWAEADGRHTPLAPRLAGRAHRSQGAALG